MEGAELVQTGEWRLNDREQGVGTVSTRGRDLGRPFRKKASGSTSGYSAYGGIDHHIAPAPSILMLISHPPQSTDACSRMKTHLVDLLINR